ncbi:MAG: hypothetical protein ACP5IL_10755 [Syntrophobacteraceae bacterium]
MRFLTTLCGVQVRIEGGLLRIARLEADSFQFLDEPRPMLEALRSCGTRVDLFTFLQRLPQTSPMYEFPMEWDNLAVLPVTTFDRWWNEQIGFKARNKAKQAEKKGVVVCEVPFDDALVRGIWKVYNESPVRQGRPFAHYGKGLETVYRDEATFLESSIFIGAFWEGLLIGFIKLVHDERRIQAGMMNIISMMGHRDKAPTNALVAQAVKSCAQRGISYLVYSKFTYGNKHRDGIIDFKQRNAFERFDVPRYYVPLTSLGSLSFRLGLHKRFGERIPEPLLGKLRQIRANRCARTGK